ncbi:hypothetical protein [Pedobacter sp. UBA5917]|jgi:hypothetical protein|uniref:hypothetical protein n=1 Tax=Pedobacter sp. UBA5917 TaxID=1947061 RepID=UPI0025CFF32F|nr:hypothetical protein [Pedobacter sp. UBA5917]
MNIKNYGSYLILKVIWKDIHMLEIGVEVTNGRYSGKTEFYESAENLKKFATLLSGYPNGNNAAIYEAGEKNGYSYFGAKFSVLNRSGHISVLINLEENVSTEYRADEKDKLKLEIIVEPNAIDIFQKQLLQLAINEEGVAILCGRKN